MPRKHYRVDSGRVYIPSAISYYHLPLVLDNSMVAMQALLKNVSMDANNHNDSIPKIMRIVFTKQQDPKAIGCL